MSGGKCPGGTCPGGLCPRTVAHGVIINPMKMTSFKVIFHFYFLNINILIIILLACTNFCICLVNILI